MTGVGEGRIQQFGRQCLDVFMADAKYVSDLWKEDTVRSSKLILVGIRTLVGLAAVRLTCQLLKTMTTLPRMTAFSFLDTTVVILFKAILLHDIFKFTSNLTAHADLRDGILPGIFSVDPTTTDSYGRELNPFLEGTLIPSVWNRVFLKLQMIQEFQELQRAQERLPASIFNRMYARFEEKWRGI